MKGNFFFFWTKFWEFRIHFQITYRRTENPHILMQVRHGNIVAFPIIKEYFPRKKKNTYHRKTNGFIATHGIYKKKKKERINRIRYINYQFFNDYFLFNFFIFYLKRFYELRKNELRVGSDSVTGETMFFFTFCFF